MTGNRATAWNPVVTELLAAASPDRTVVVWRVPDRGPAALVSVLAPHTDTVNSLAWMPDGRRLICVSQDGRAAMWDALLGVFRADLSSHDTHCTMVAVSPAGLVATVSEDGLIIVGHPDSGVENLAFRHYDSAVECCAWSHSGRTLAVGCDDGTVDLLTDEGLGHLRTVEVPGAAARTVEWAADDRSFVVGADDGSLHFFSIADERTDRSPAAPERYGNHASAARRPSPPFNLDQENT
ncbi:hypothetical protein AB0K09_31135 [Streptomyces sp. NPDC049577]|uniref:WD40 repeat domain-containing protein n=1 Tax=Streptomyces sp. NPDC049577 TaxID=3155153 RepID=UPI00341897F1